MTDRRAVSRFLAHPECGMSRTRLVQRAGNRSRPIRLFAITALVFASIPQAFAAPAITAVMNAASNTPPPLPTASLAPGSIFIVKGTGLGPASISVAPAAFQSTTLSGTSVSLTVDGTKVDALMYYTSDKQIAALLPSNTPVGGPGTITVTYNGQNSPRQRSAA